MATKYIVNNVTGQTITGDLTINGNVTITGVTTNNNTSIYRALLTQTISITGFSITDFNQGLIIGETYTISNYIGGDDFSNIADVQSGTINTSGCIFTATGEIPTNYGNGSTLVSNGDLVVNVLENTLGYDLTWVQAPFGGYGYYIAFNNNIGPENNAFPRNNVEIITQTTYPYWGLGFPYIYVLPSITNFIGKDSFININVLDLDLGDYTDNALYYTPVEIKIKNDVTPIQINGTISPSFPFNNVSYTLYCNGNSIGSYYTNQTVNNVAEVVAKLNGDSETNQFGVFSEDGIGGIILTMTTSTKQKLCEDNELTFDVFND